MRFSSITLAALVPTLALAETIIVRVGDGGLVFNPAEITARVDDIVSFEFVAKNHTVTQSLFATPCTQAVDAVSGQRGVDSGFVPVPPGTTPLPRYSIKIVNADAPLWFYCAQGNHCTSGMVFSINPTADKTHAQFVANARAAVPGAPPAPPVGGAPPSATDPASAPAPSDGVPVAPPAGPSGSIPSSPAPSGPVAPGSGFSGSGGPNGPLPTPIPPPPEVPGEAEGAQGAPGNNGNGAARVGGSAAALTFAALVAGVFLL